MKVWKATVSEVKIFEPDFFCSVEIDKWYFGAINICVPQGPFDSEELAEKALLAFNASTDNG